MPNDRMAKANALKRGHWPCGIILIPA